MAEDILSKDKKYEEIGKNYRFFLLWRQALFAGYFVIIGYILTNDIFQKNHWLWWVNISIFGFLFYLIDRRIRSLYLVAMVAGKIIEGGEEGIYSNLIKKRENKIGHTKIISYIYLTPLIILIYEILRNQLFFIQGAF